MSVSRASHPQAPSTKTVVIFRNGDAFYPGRRFVISQRQSSTFDSFLNTVTRGLTAPFGAVRNIYTPDEGHRVQDLEQLMHGHIYVAAGAEKLKKLDYHHITIQKPQKKKNEQIRPVVHSRIIVPARWKRISNEPCTINVFTNGDILVPPARVLIPKHTLTSWENILVMVTEKIHLRTGAVHRLCMLNGKPLCGGNELHNNHYYVAVGAERFRHLPYYQMVPSKGVIHDLTDAISTGILPALTRGKEDGKSKLGVDDGGSVFYARVDQAKPPGQASKKAGQSGTGVSSEKSIFKATNKRKETATASEVPEDESIKVDLPIEQIDDKEVEEEQSLHKDSQKEIGGKNPEKDYSEHPDETSPLSTQKILEHTSHMKNQERPYQLNSHGDSRNKT